MVAIGPKIAKSIINFNGGVAKENKYRVVMPTLFIGGDAITMDVLCRSTSLPGKVIATADRKTNMKKIAVPTGYEVADIEITFTEPANRNVSRYFDIWLDRIVDKKNYNIAYKDDIVRDILVMSTDDNGIPNYIVTLRNAFPVIKTPIPLTDKSENAISEVSVTFSYEDFKVHDSTLLSGASDLSRQISANSFVVPTNILRGITSGINIDRGIL